MPSDPIMSADHHEPVYGIGAVARLTGIRLESLRAWERRYRVVTPRRSDGNQRLYSREDVTRLQLIKQLVDRGHAVSSVAALSEQVLRERLRLHLGARPEVHPDERPLRVMVYGDVLPYLVESWRTDLNFELLGTHAGFSAFESDAIELRPEVLILELPSLNADVPGRVRDLRLKSGARAVVIYSFGPQSVIDRLRRDAVMTLRAPVTPRELERACYAEGEDAAEVRLPVPGMPGEPDELPARRFDGQQLAAIASGVTGIRCECPHHLADLVLRLGAFETYSADCESRNEQDAALHAQLHRTAAKARALMEEALHELMRYEGVDLTLPR